MPALSEKSDKEMAAMGLLRCALNPLLIAAGIILLFPLQAYSYIDPGTGSYLFQIIIAAFLVVSFFVKSKWQKIKKFFGRIFSKKEP